MIYFMLSICLYGLFRAYLDSLHVKSIENISVQLSDIQDSLYKINMKINDDSEKSHEEK